MRPRRTDPETAAAARRRLDLLSAELAARRQDTAGTTGTAEGDREPDARPDPARLPGSSLLPEGARQAEGAWQAEGAGRAPDGQACGVAQHPVPAFASPSIPHGSPSGAAKPRPSGRHARRPLPVRGRVGRWLHDRLPSTMQGRVALGARHLAAIALVAAVAFAVTAWWVLRTGGTATVVAPAGDSTRLSALPSSAEPLVTPAAAPAAPGVAPAAPGAAAGSGGVGRSVTASIVVDVAGKVRQPGIVTLPEGSRVVDAIEEAGGVRKGVDLTHLNLARVLADGEQIVVGLAPPGGVAASAASSGGAARAPAATMVNVNTATAAQLEELPGVGPVTAAAIVEWRAEHGAFTAVDELLEVSGIGEATLSDIAPHVTL